MPRFATIDIGTNSVLLLVAERRPDGSFEPVAEEAEITRLGRGVDATHTLSEQGMKDTLTVLARYAATAKALMAEGFAVTATSAARDATNGAQFRAEAKRRTGLTLEILSGDEEARLSFLAVEARYGGPGKSLVVLDIGGGSTELIYGGREAPTVGDAGTSATVGDSETLTCGSGLPTATGPAGHLGQVGFRRSFDVGAVRLTERFVHGDPVPAAEQAAVLDHLRGVFAEAPEPPPGFTLVGVAGTVTTLYAVQHGLAPYDAAQVEGNALTLAQVRALRERLCATPLAERRTLPGLQPKRADVICAGAMILEAAMERLTAEQVVVSDRGVRWGLLADRFGGER
jgi:exopolyphosphatase/guanosine-5'-triphosphate,3'-diphosphate pyrophosphatase